MIPKRSELKPQLPPFYVAGLAVFKQMIESNCPELFVLKAWRLLVVSPDERIGIIRSHYVRA